eukprot:766917-Hanusia_phi.AAC.2
MRPQFHNFIISDESDICLEFDTSKHLENFPRNLYLVHIVEDSIISQNITPNNTAKVQTFLSRVHALLKKCLETISSSGSAPFLNMLQVDEEKFFQELRGYFPTSVVSRTLTGWIIELECKVFTKCPQLRMETLHNEELRREQSSSGAADERRKLAKQRKIEAEQQQQQQQQQKIVSDLRAMNEELMSQLEGFRSTSDRDKCIYCLRARRCCCHAAQNLTCSAAGMQASCRPLWPYARLFSAQV